MVPKRRIFKHLTRGKDGTNDYFRQNFGCSTEQKTVFRSEPFHGRENNSEFISVEQKWKQTLGIPFQILQRKRKKKLGIAFPGTKIEAHSWNSLPNPSAKATNWSFLFQFKL
jgi:hypothetical protein